MKRSIIFLLPFALVLAACGGGSTTGTAVPTQSVTEPAAEPSVPPTIEQGEAEDVIAGEATFIVVPEESEVRFRIGEVLSGQDNEVVGITSAVEGSFQLDLSNPAGASFDPILIEADTFITDNQRRNGAIQRFILETGQPGNELITFQPNQIEGMPDTVQIGESYQLTISGDLTVHGVTRQETFTGVVTALSEERLQGSMSTVTAWGDYDITIPQVPLVASVDDELTLEIDFMAERQ